MRPRGRVRALRESVTGESERVEAEVERLLELSCAGPDALDDLERAVRRLREVQTAKVKLAGFPSKDVRLAITQRHERLAAEGREEG